MQAIQFFNENIFYQFLSGVFSIILTVTVIYLKREIDRNKRENYYNGLTEKENFLGDIKIKINEELPSENYFKLITMWGIQPLLLIVLINFIDNNNTYIKISLLFLLFIFTLLHEFSTGLKYSDKLIYQIIMLSIWIISFSTLSFQKNKSVNNGKENNETHDTKIQNKQNQSTLYIFNCEHGIT